ncbi:MAG TPA: hypothetical protein VL201_04590 [Patescibacteria group bacterium]|nr:hypothetical protein [Patescibacteria group bacterium]
MITKKAAFFMLLFTVHYNYSYTPAAGVIMDSVTRSRKPCTGKTAKEKQPLLTKAEQYEQDFIKAHTACKKAHDCGSNQFFQETKNNIEQILLDLSFYLANLENEKDEACHACEKTEAKDIKNRLIALLSAASQQNS